jgi:hypothetical protein
MLKGNYAGKNFYENNKKKLYLFLHLMLKISKKK